MSTALAVQTNGVPMAPSGRVQLGGASAMAQTIEDLNTIREFVASAMVKDLDYGVIPGTGSKATLLQPGAQKILMYLNCYPDYEVEPRELEGGHVEYIVKTMLRSRTSQAMVGSGIGSCSTMEAKYRWRKGGRVCPKCGSDAIINGKAEYGGGFICFGKKGGCGAKFAEGDAAITSQSAGRVENPDIYDARNTVLKMAKKRSLVDSAHGLGCMSELFTQDMEDFAHAPDHDDRPAREEPRRDPEPAREPQAPRRPQGQNSNRAPAPAAPRWAAYLSSEVANANREWDEEFRSETGKNPEDHPEFTSALNAAHAVCTAAIEAKLITQADVGKADKPEARDPKKAAAILGKLFTDKPDAIRDLLAAYLKAKRQKTRAQHGMIDPESPDDDAPADTAGQDKAEDVSQEVPETPSAGRQPGDDDDK